MADATHAAVASGEPVISVRDVGVRFRRQGRAGFRTFKDLFRPRASKPPEREFWALRHISFDVAEGEAIGVVGRNGQGKSTLLKLVAQVLLPDEGTVTVRQGVAPLIEITGGFQRDLTVRDNVYLAAGLKGMRRREVDERYDEIIEFAELQQFTRTPFRHLSSGMKARLAFAVVSRLEQPIMLVDEVLAVGDAAFRMKCFQRIDELLAEGRTLFFVSHSRDNLRRFCTRGLYIRDHELAMDAPIDDVLEQYRSDYLPAGDEGQPPFDDDGDDDDSDEP